jgi:2,4-dienoyl-CoA reductase-like NADH-dependent reductase (Old Yellow Enzyme family)
VARGGVGMTTIAYSAVSPAGRTFAKQLVLAGSGPAVTPEADLRRLIDAVHAAGAKIAFQVCIRVEVRRDWGWGRLLRGNTHHVWRLCSS